MIIAIDFDGTCVTHEFPRVGRDIGAPRVLRRLIEAGHQLILFTMRSDLEPAFWKKEVDQDNPEIVKISGKYLTDAVDWFAENNIPLYGIQLNPTQAKWTTSNKCYAQLYIDDAALGCPLVREEGFRPYVDWMDVEVILEDSGILPVLKATRSQLVAAFHQNGIVDPVYIQRWLELTKNRWVED